MSLEKFHLQFFMVFVFEKKKEKRESEVYPIRRKCCIIFAKQRVANETLSNNKFSTPSYTICKVHVF